VLASLKATSSILASSENSQKVTYYAISKIHTETKQLAKILSGGRSCLNCGFDAKAPKTSNAKI
jgi:hypothetical protein